MSSSSSTSLSRQAAVQNYKSGVSSAQGKLWVTPSKAVITWGGAVIASPTKR